MTCSTTWIDSIADAPVLILDLKSPLFLRANREQMLKNPVRISSASVLQLPAFICPNLLRTALFIFSKTARFAGKQRVFAALFSPTLYP
jgi:hypothetical protein